MPFRRLKWWNLAKNDEPPMMSCSLTRFQSKSSTNLREFEFRCKKKNEHQIENFQKKFHFEGQNDGIWPKNKEPPTKSCSVTHLQPKSSINLCKSKFRRKIKWALKQNYFKKCHFGGRNYGIWLKNDKPLMESYSLTHFQSKSYTNLRESKLRRKIKRAPKQKFSKNGHFGGQKEWNFA